MLLANAVYATDTLLDLHRIPWKVIVDEDVTELQVAPFAASLSANENLRPIPVTDLVNGAILFFGGQLAVELLQVPTAREKVREHLLGLAELCENQDFSVGFFVEEA